MEFQEYQKKAILSPPFKYERQEKKEQFYVNINVIFVKKF